MESRRVEAPTVAAALLGRILTPATRRQGFVDARLLTDWPTIIGPERALDTLPLRLDRRSRTLSLRVPPSAALIVQHEEPRLLERINTFFGSQIAVRLRLVQGPIPQPPEPVAATPLPAGEEARIEAVVAEVEAEGLRASLASLGRAVARRRYRSSVLEAEPDGR